ncbi:MAG: hypothetical protein OER89_17195 [Gemmatimonadota bacterium]|nr:hypothetical protein [Gemmatimonadota bacterium]MDH3571909.1 hypothetical protein [Gemmatimonadota bacterium]
MTARRVAAMLAGLTLAGGLVTCGSEPAAPPTPGWVNVRLTTPNLDDGGILFTVTGAQIDSVRSTFPNTFLRRESASSMRVVIVGNLVAGTVAQVLVPDVRQAATYAGTVVEVAVRSTFAQRPTAGYVLTVEQPPTP